MPNIDRSNPRVFYSLQSAFVTNIIIHKLDYETDT